eukprot:770768-Ditylum_brightwellii.AAC.1
MAMGAIKIGFAKDNEDVERNHPVFNDKKQWGSDNDKKDDNSQDCITHVMRDVGGRALSQA